MTWNLTDNWPWSTRLCIIGLVFILALAIGYQFDTASCWNYLSAKQTQVQKLQLHLAQQQQKTKYLTDYKNKLQTAQHNFSQSLKLLPDKEQVPVLLDDISQTGIVDDLELKLLKLAPEKPQADFIEIPIKISAIGHYLPLLRFIKQLAQLPWLVVIKDFGLQKLPQAEDKLSLTMTCMTYRYANKIFSDKPTTLFLGLAKQLHNPFQSINKAGPLSSYALNAMKLVGTLRRGKKTLALIAMPDNKIYAVQLGMRLGQQAGEVTHITENKLEVTQPDKRLITLIMK